MNAKQLKEAAQYLSDQDPILGRLVRSFKLQPLKKSDAWWELIDSITSQQLSTKAAATILQRFENLFLHRPTPKDIINADHEFLRSAGLSNAKARYIKDLAERVSSGELRLDELVDLSDEDVIAKLIEVKGIGRWTAEMFLIFHLGRPDVLPVDDLGFREAAKRLYSLPERPNGAELQEMGEKWCPYRSVATRYLWKSLEQV